MRPDPNGEPNPAPSWWSCASTDGPNALADVPPDVYTDPRADSSDGASTRVMMLITPLIASAP